MSIELELAAKADDEVSTLMVQSDVADSNDGLFLNSKSFDRIFREVREVVDIVEDVVVFVAADDSIAENTSIAAPTVDAVAADDVDDLVSSSIGFESKFNTLGNSCSLISCCKYSLPSSSQRCTAASLLISITGTASNCCGG